MRAAGLIGWHLRRRLRGPANGRRLPGAPHQRDGNRRQGAAQAVWQGEVHEEGFSAHRFDSDPEFVRQFLAGSPDGPLGMDA